MNTKMLFLLFALLGSLLTSCEYPTQPTQEVNIVSETPLAWIDSPLDGMYFTPGAYQIIAHGSDLVGIDQMEISINGLPLVREPGIGIDKTLVTLAKDWNPTEPGEYQIRVRAMNNESVWSEPAQAIVWIVNPTITALPMNTLEPSPTITRSPTITAIPLNTVEPTPTVTPSPTLQTEYLKDVVISPTLISQKNSCSNLKITADVHAFDPDGIYVLALYYRLKDSRSGEVSEWYNADTVRIHGDLYRAIFAPAPSGHPLREFVNPRLEREGDEFAAQVQIQFVMHDLQGSILRSAVDTSVTLKGCVP